MTAYLADTHVILWLWQAPDRLSMAQREVLFSDAPRFGSVASIWEMAIKAGLGKLDAPVGIEAELDRSGFDLLPIAPSHAEAVRHLPGHHGDPFDRMLIAQAQVERLTILTADPRFAAYGVAVM